MVSEARRRGQENFLSVLKISLTLPGSDSSLCAHDNGDNGVADVPSLEVPVTPATVMILRVRLAVVLAAALWLLPAAVSGQALYGSVTGTIADDSGASVPGVTVDLTNEGTGLEVTTVTDDQGSYTLRNVLPGSYTLRAALQGFKAFVQTGIAVTAGNILRVNGQLEVGELTESVTVISETALLKTDKADVSVELKSKEIINLPLNQFRNYQALMNLVPGATPGAFQNSQGATPQRSLRTFVNGTNPNNNLTRIDGAASINLWLPHHAGYVAPAETIDTVNISTNNFEADTGMAGGARSPW